MTDNVKMKRCSRGDRCVHPRGCWQPATQEYFKRRSKNNDKLRATCKACDLEYNRQWGHKNAAKMRLYHREYRRQHPDDEAEKQRRYRENNRDKRSAASRKYYRNNRLRVLHYFKTRRLQHPEQARERDKKSRLNRPSQLHVSNQRRRARKHALPDTFTSADWERALDYFNGCCAVCGRQLRDLFSTHTAAMDHWIPLISPDCPGTVPENIIPLCHGQGGCNNTKGAKDPQTWLVERFGKRRAKQIVTRIEAYFTWIKSLK